MVHAYTIRLTNVLVGVLLASAVLFALLRNF